MATSKTKKDVVRITDDDFKGKGNFKTAPAGKFQFTVNKAQSKIVPGNDGNIMRTVLTIKSGEHKGVNVFDNIAPHVGWKIVQILMGIGMKESKVKALVKKGITIQEVLKLVAGKDIRAVIKRENSDHYGKQNKVVQYLPPGAEGDEDEEEDEDLDDEDEEEDEDLDEEDEEDEEEDEDEEDDDEEDDDEEDEGDEEDDDEEDEDEEDEDEGEDEDEEDEDEEEDAPPPRRKVAKKVAAKKKTAKKRK